MGVWGSEQQAVFEKAEILVKRTEALGSCQIGLPSELNVSVIPEDTAWALWQKQDMETTPTFAMAQIPP